MNGFILLLIIFLLVTFLQFSPNIPTFNLVLKCVLKYNYPKTFNLLTAILILRSLSGIEYY